MSGSDVQPLVKICGFTRAEDGRDAVAAGASWLGLNFWPRSKRYVGELARAREIAAAARAEAGSRGIMLVGVFVNQPVEEMLELAQAVGLDIVQPHGDEDEAFLAALRAQRSVRVMRAFALGAPGDVERVVRDEGELCLVDTPSAGYGGSGHTFDWQLARAAVATGKRVFLAGGLHPDNVAAAVAAVHPYGVDVASGVESAPGIKDAAKMRAFIAAARSAA